MCLTDSNYWNTNKKTTAWCPSGTCPHVHKYFGKRRFQNCIVSIQYQSKVCNLWLVLYVLTFGKVHFKPLQTVLLKDPFQDETSVSAITSCLTASKVCTFVSVFMFFLFCFHVVFHFYKLRVISPPAAFACTWKLVSCTFMLRYIFQHQSRFVCF